MAKSYQKANSSFAVRWSKQLILLIIAYIAGYISHSLADMSQINAWLSLVPSIDGSMDHARQLQKQAQLRKPRLEFYTLLTANHENIEAPPVPAATPETSVKMLAQTNAAVSTSVQPNVNVKKEPVSLTQQTVPPSSSVRPVVVVKPAQINKIIPENVLDKKLAYTIQVAALRLRRDAEKIRASLVLKGFEVNIIAANSPQGKWFRVLVGPYYSKSDAEQTQILLARREHLNGMIKKMSG